MTPSFCLFAAILSTTANGGAPFQPALTNAAQHLTVRFEQGGARFLHQGGSFHLALANGERAAKVQQQGNRVEIDHGHITEWYVNLPEGLEHGFTIQKRQGPLRLELAVSGGYAPALDAGDVVLRPVAAHRVTLRYGGLKAWDATGRELPSHPEVSGNRIRLIVADEGARYPVTVDPIFQEQPPVSEPSSIGDYYGSAIAASGDTVAIGAPYYELRGHVLVFVRSSTGWQVQQRLLPPTSVTGQFFGTAVAISGDTLVVGAPGDGNPAKTGVYVYTRTAGQWSLVKSFLPASDQAAAHFGKSVAVEGDLVAFSTLHLQGSYGGGGAMIYRRSGNSWTAELYYTGTSNVLPVRDTTIAFSGNAAAIGKPGESGKVLMIRHNGTEWIGEAGLGLIVGTSSEMANAPASSNFGQSIAFSGDTVLVGAPGSAVVYTYRKIASTWLYQGAITSPTGNDRFGSSVALSGDLALIGAPGANALNGAAYLYSRSGSGWTRLPFDAVAGNAFGRSVALARNRILIGAPGNLGVSPIGELLLPAIPGAAHSYALQNVSILSNPSGSSFQLTGAGCGETGTFTTPYLGYWSNCSLAWTNPSPAGAATRHSWKSWSDGVSQPARDFTLLADPSQPLSTFIGDFIKEYQLTTSTAPVPGGAITGAGWYPAKGSAAVNASANPGFVFTGYSGDLSGLASSQTLLMDAPKSITANFAPTPPAALSGAITAKSGTAAARQWTITLTNLGPGIAYAANLFGLMFVQTFGTPCTSLPVRLDPTALPLPLGTLAAGARTSANMTFDFTGCPANARFNVVLTYMSNGGASGGLLQLVNQFQ